MSELKKVISERYTPGKPHVLRLITKKTLVLVTCAFLSSMFFIWLMFSWQTREDAYDMVESNVVDISLDIRDKSFEFFTSTFQSFSSLVAEFGPEEALESFIKKGYDHLYIVDAQGNVLLSENPAYVGRNVLDLGDAITKRFDEINSWDNSFGNLEDQVFFGSETALDFDQVSECYYFVLPAKDMEYCLIAGVKASLFRAIMAVQGQYMALNRRVGNEGFDILLDDHLLSIISMPDFTHYRELFPSPEVIADFLNGDGTEKCTRKRSYSAQEFVYDVGKGSLEFYGEKYFYAITSTGYYFVLSLYPYNEAYAGMRQTLLLIILLQTFIFIVLFQSMKRLIYGEVVQKLETVNLSLGIITGGNLEEKVDVRDTYEFDRLSTDINATVDTLKAYIDEAAARIDADLALAREIQTSSLPNVFPPFPERREFDLYASMRAAKEVGGDFYDFSLLNADTLGFLIADVSGKSIPGAMFMMRAKSVIKSLTESGLSVDEVLTQANDSLCFNNDAGMFVTAWLGSMDIRTGRVEVGNAGHNPPVLIRDGKAEYVQLEAALMLGTIPGMPYLNQTLQLRKGDFLFLYTDGVTEAMNVAEEFYGEERLLEVLSVKEEDLPDHEQGKCGAVCQLVQEDLAGFGRGAEQFDDITMLCVRYNGPEPEC